MAETPRIVALPAAKLVGMSQVMSRLSDTTAALWGGFMRRRGEVSGRTTHSYVSMQIFPQGPKQLADPAASFTKWAAVEVKDFDRIPSGMAAYTRQAGTYAVFIHNGPATDISTFMYIFNEWLPNAADYELADREHFEVLPPDYSPLDPHAREEIWIPVRARASA